jgi:hypothetical protein
MLLPSRPPPPPARAAARSRLLRLLLVDRRALVQRTVALVLRPHHLAQLGDADLRHGVLGVAGGVGWLDGWVWWFSRGRLVEAVERSGAVD